MNRALVQVSPHVRSRPFAAEFEAIHTELFAARDLEKRIEAAVALYLSPEIEELLQLQEWR